MNLTIGKAKVTLKSEGCVHCGTQWSSGWNVFQTLYVSIGDRNGELTIHVCADCVNKVNAPPPAVAVDGQLELLHA